MIYSMQQCSQWACTGSNFHKANIYSNMQKSIYVVENMHMQCSLVATKVILYYYPYTGDTGLRGSNGEPGIKGTKGDQGAS